MGFLGTAAAFIVTVVTALLFGFMVQRMLGLRLGIVRLLLGGAFAVLVTQPILVNVVDRISRDGYNDKRLWRFLLLAAFVVLLAAWKVAGIGVGVAYPTLYMLCTPSGRGELDSAELATAVITAEAFGGLLGRTAGGAVASLDATTTLSRQASLMAAYALFAVILFGAAMAAARSGHRTTTAV